jgi:hypothetical protein
VGGDGVTERIAFPNSCGNGRAFDQILSIALEMVKNTNARATAIMESQWRALERISFHSVRPQLAAFFNNLGKVIEVTPVAPKVAPAARLKKK